MLILKFLAFYLPLEELFLKWLPVSDQVYLVLRQMPDLLVMGLAASLLTYRLAIARSIPAVGGRVDLYLVLFVFWSFATILVNQGADLFICMLNIKALLRYILLLYILLLLNPSPEQIRNLIKWIVAAVTVQALMGVVQLVGGLSVRDFLAARHVSEGIGGAVKKFTGDRFEGQNDLMGTMGDNISYGYLIMLGVILILFKSQRSIGIRALFALFLITLTFLSGSKAIFLVSLMVGYGYCLWRWGRSNTLLMSFLVLPLLAIVTYLVLPGDVIETAKVSSQRLFEGMMNSRLGILVYIMPELLWNPYSVIGFSPDKDFFSDFVEASLPSIPTVLLVVLSHVIEDVYWAAMYIYYGMIGFALWCLFLRSIYKRLKPLTSSPSLLMQYLGRVATIMILVSVPLNFFNQSFEVRSFSFYLWLFCGLALVQRRQFTHISSPAT